jgi:hypothetical protein
MTPNGDPSLPKERRPRRRFAYPSSAFAKATADRSALPQSGRAPSPAPTLLCELRRAGRRRLSPPPPPTHILRRMALYASEDHWRDIVRGRLALALVAGRAQNCPNRKCARARRCLGEARGNDHEPMGCCPNMTRKEWRAVSLGMRRNFLRGRELVKRLDAAFDNLAKAEQEAVLAAGEAAAQKPSGWKPTYWFWLWMDDGGDALVAPRDGAGLAEKLIAERAKAGCRCAQIRTMECEA